MFRTIWVLSGPFGCLPKLGAKQAELVQKFLPRSRAGIFRNERTDTPPLDPKLMFWCVSYYLGAFGTVWLPYETRFKSGRTSAKVRATKWRRNFSQPFVSYYLGSFGIVLLPYKTRGKTCRTSAKVRATKSRRDFSQQKHRIHPIGP